MKCKILISVLLAFGSLNAMKPDENDIDNAITYHGFDLVHKIGLHGEGQKIAFLEGFRSVKESPLLHGKVKRVDLALTEKPYEGCDDILGDDVRKGATWGGSNPMAADKKKESSLKDHSVQVMALAVGIPNDKGTPKKFISHSGGACPEAIAKQINFSMRYCDHHLNPYPIGVNIKKHESQLKECETCSAIFDDSFYKALLWAIQFSDAQVINLSNHAVVSILGPDGIPAEYLDTLLKCLKEKDKILVFAGCNFIVKDLLLEAVNKAFNSLAKHKISEHILISLNARLVSDDASMKSYVLGNEVTPVKVTLPNKKERLLVLHETSNTTVALPWNKCAVTAIGSDIEFGEMDPSDPKYDERFKNNIVKDSGTSLSAPLVSSLCALLKQANKGLTAPNIVSIIKETCIKLGDLYGNGLINPPLAIEKARTFFN